MPPATPERPAAPDETVRYRPAGAGDALPPVTPPRPETGDDGADRAAAPAEHDDTRPVGRDWQAGAPEPGVPASGEPRPGTEPTGTGPTGTEPTGTEPTGTEPTVAPGEQPDDVTARIPAGAGAPDPAGDRPGADATPGTPDPDGTHPGGTDPGGTDPAGRPDADRPRWRRPAVLVPAGVLAVLAALYGGDLLLAQGEVPRGTVVAGVPVGGTTPAAATTVLEEQLVPVVAAERTVVAGDVQQPLSPAAAGLAVDLPATVDAAAEQPLNPWTRLTTLFGERPVDAVLTRDQPALDAQLQAVAAQVDRPPVDATVVLEGTEPGLVEPADGRSLDQPGAAEAVTDALAAGADPADPIELPVDVDPFDVGTGEARRVLEEVVDPALAAPVEVVSEDGATSTQVPVEAIAAALTFTPQEDGELDVAVDPAALRTALGDELGRFGAPAQDAGFELSDGGVRVVPSADGTGIDPARLAEQLLDVLPDPAPRSVTATLGPVPAEFTTSEAEALGIREEISSFTTPIGNPDSGENIRVVAEEVDGTVVLPGETFSLNDLTGPRGLAQGYVEAAVINNGEFTTGVGGGVSQFATTMFNAVFFAGLEDVFHKPHSYYISRYPAGREATVYYDSIDLQWRNDSDTGVYVDTTWTPSTFTVTFYGTPRYEIESVSSARYDVRPPAVQERPQDGSCRETSGTTGFGITVTRIFRDLDTGEELRREDFRTRYATEPAIRCVDPAPPTDAAPPTEPADPAVPPADGG